MQYKIRRKDQERVDKVLDYIENNSDYNIEHYLNKYKLLDGAKMQGSNYMISCPFHGSDSSPSMSIDLKNNRFRCFGCGIKGKLINFIIEYSNKYLGTNLTFISTVEMLLREDPVMRATLKFNSIYKTKTLNELREIKRTKLDSKCMLPATYSELATMMKRRKISIDEILRMLFLVQEGLEPQEIFNFIIKGQSLESSVLDISTIINGGN